MRIISFHSPKDIIKCHFALSSTRICKSRINPRKSIIVEKLFEKTNSVENRDREISFRFFETENGEMGCHSRIENDFVELSTTLERSPPSGFFREFSFAPKKYGRSSKDTFPSRITFTKFFKALRKFSPVCPFNLAVKSFKISGEIPSNLH